MLIPFKDIVRKYGKPKGILHVGANVGEEAKAYDEMGVKQVAWIEANAELIPRLRDNVAKYGHSVLQTCVGDIPGKEVIFHIANNVGQSSSLLELGTHITAHPEVHYIRDVTMKMERIDDLFYMGALPTANPPDFLNMDLQGAEKIALIGMGDTLNFFKYAYLEVNKEELYKDCALIGEIDAYMKGFGFKRVETKWCCSTGWGDALYIKR